MNLNQTQLNILQSPKDLSDKVSTGVSLHCHTEHSKEMLDFVPVYASKLPVISYFWEKERKKYIEREGKPIDFETAYWSPPLAFEDVYRIEQEQINGAGLDAIVSITDHDEIAGNLKINETTSNDIAPISLEWTVPFEYGFFHLGVHNLPKDRAESITEDLLAFTFGENPSNERLHELFELLNSIPEVLVIFNHPIWDIEMVGEERHMILLKRFLKEHGKWIHALEINGFRSWSENKEVIELAEALGFPIATGGDRHGCKANTMINLTNKTSFSEFAEEIRVSKKSEVVLMPEYSQPLHSRQLQSFSEILSHYPEYRLGRQRWFDRVYFDIGDERGLASLSQHGWERGGPVWLRMAIKVLAFSGGKTMRPVFSLFRRKADRVPTSLNETLFELPDVAEITRSFPQTPESTGSAS